MKRFLFLSLAVFFTAVACQKEEFTETQNNEESLFIEDGQLTRLVMSVAAHDGSFDDIAYYHALIKGILNTWWHRCFSFLKHIGHSLHIGIHIPLHPA